jgi:hypothetical protein
MFALSPQSGPKQTLVHRAGIHRSRLASAAAERYGMGRSRTTLPEMVGGFGFGFGRPHSSQDIASKILSQSAPLRVGRL